jgi:hypothetical protein
MKYVNPNIGQCITKKKTLVLVPRDKLFTKAINQALLEIILFQKNLNGVVIRQLRIYFSCHFIPSFRPNNGIIIFVWLKDVEI